jgi:hypothetical protein
MMRVVVDASCCRCCDYASVSCECAYLVHGRYAFVGKVLGGSGGRDQVVRDGAMMERGGGARWARGECDSGATVVQSMRNRSCRVAMGLLVKGVWCELVASAIV